MDKAEHRAVEHLFIQALALVYAIAFASYGVQVAGLIGLHGIQPAGYADWILRSACVAGVACACCALVGFFWRFAFLGAYLLWLGLVTVSREFLSFQWDYLLLEAGFLALFLGWSPLIVWLYRFLLFRLMLGSGLVKLLSGDVTWRRLSALLYHYETQPIPNPLAWYAHQLPVWAQKTSCGIMLAIELGAPFLIFAPRRFRLAGGAALAGLQVLILSTGNYAFFNLLTLALCLPLLDDASLPPRKPPHRFLGRIAQTAAVSIGLLGLLQIGSMFFEKLSVNVPYGIVNSYGLFAVMTTERPEIVVEGSNDGVNWLAYEFPHKPGNLDRRPPFVAPHQPRLDWQMWFAALGSYRENVWFLRFLQRLLEGRPEVLRLMEGNPFPGHPPAFIRARLYKYRFAPPGTRAWWIRMPAGLYVPAVSREDLERVLQ